MTPRMLPNGSTTEAVTKPPVPRSVMGSWIVAPSSAYPQPGRGGGWALLGGARTDLSGLNATEAQALFLLLGPAASIVAEAKSALRKLVRALPDTFRAEAETAASAVVVDSTAWGEREKGRPPLVKILQAAVVRCRKVRLVYAR